MNLKYLLVLFILNLGACKLMPKNDPNESVFINQDDSILVNQKFSRTRQLFLGHDSDEYRSAAAKLMITMIYTQQDTSAYIAQLSNDTSGYFAGYEKLQKLKCEDSTVMKFYYEILQLRNEYPALIHGKYKILDEKNPYSCGFERIDSKDTILVILNMDEDNQGFKENFNYSQMTLLLSNYEDGPLPQIMNSLALRPYEIRISKL